MRARLDKKRQKTEVLFYLRFTLLTCRTEKRNELCLFPDYIAFYTHRRGVVTYIKIIIIGYSQAHMSGPQALADWSSNLDYSCHAGVIFCSLKIRKLTVTPKTWCYLWSNICSSIFCFSSQDLSSADSCMSG
ncbi:hypothetical protein GDO81_018502 [Engystomops pustulosus]|uniref:Uncharacterized protein n=1 Tax=Engystomops pustulosus TaxID=76066 RepID=A0AAV6YLB6_ENGPU|nr:hypothetical protein GDO81_018502 [Engystomops pustulosus]